MTDEEKVPVNWSHFFIGFTLLVGIIIPAMLWLARFLWSHALQGVWW